jgi:glycosyltransferase involved in cell wall biosynthesis
MKILHIFPSQYLGGSELCAFETIKALEAAGIDNYVVFPKYGAFIEQVSPHLKGYTLIYSFWWMSLKQRNILARLKMLRGYFLAAWKIRKYISEHEIDMVITHTMVLPSGAIAARMAQVPHIWYIHEYGDIDHHFVFNYGKRITLSLINRLTDKIIVNSMALLSYYNSFFDSNKMEQVYYAVNYPVQQPMIRKEKNSLSICMVGRIAKGKNQLVALHALAQLKKEGIFPTVVFVGSIDENYLQELNAFSLEMGISRQISYTGLHNAPWEYVQQADCVLVCSKNEAFGRVTVEAMKSGKIAIVSNTGAGTELVEHGKTGFLFDPDNAQELAGILKAIWEIDYTGYITEPAYAFANEHFNEKVHKDAILQIIQTCI